MTLNISIRKLIKSYIDSGLTAPKIYGKLNKLGCWTRRLISNTFKNILAQTLTANQIQRRKSFAQWIKNRLSREKCRSIFFSDKKWFDQDGQYNQKNDCVYAESCKQRFLYTNSFSKSHGMYWNHFSKSYRHPHLTQKQKT